MQNAILKLVKDKKNPIGENFTIQDGHQNNFAIYLGADNFTRAPLLHLVWQPMVFLRNVFCWRPNQINYQRNLLLQPFPFLASFSGLMLLSILIYFHMPSLELCFDIPICWCPFAGCLLLLKNILRLRSLPMQANFGVCFL